MPNRTNCVTSWGIRYEFDLTNTPPSIDRFYRGTVCLSSEKGKKNRGEYDRNVPSNLAFPLKLARRVKVASRRGLFLPFAWAQASARTIAFRPFFFLSFFFHGYLGGTLCLQAITESSSKRTKRFTVFSSSFLFFFRARYFFLLFPLRDFRRANRREKKLKAWRELSSAEERDGEEERFVEERERISSWEFLRQWWNCYSKRLEILFVVIFLGNFWLRENCTLQKSDFGQRGEKAWSFYETRDVTIPKFQPCFHRQ